MNTSSIRDLAGRTRPTALVLFRHAAEMITCSAFCIVFVACSPTDRVRKQFDRALSGDASVEIPGVTGFEVRSFDVLQSNRDLVVVRVTFAGKLGNDIVRTKKYRVADDGHLLAIEATDVRSGIVHNLQKISLVAGGSVAADAPVETLRFAKLAHENEMLRSIKTVAGESYENVRFTRDVFIDAELTFQGEVYRSTDRLVD